MTLGASEVNRVGLTIHTGWAALAAVSASAVIAASADLRFSQRQTEVLRLDLGKQVPEPSAASVGFEVTGVQRKFSVQI